jgi:ABC-type amino acid transport substrate-binding protein
MEKSKNQYDGFSVDLANELSKLLNFSYEISVVKNGRFGSMDSNGEWNGIMGEIIRHEADLAIAPLTITLKREKYVDFSVSFIEFGLSYHFF